MALPDDEDRAARLWAAVARRCVRRVPGGTALVTEPGRPWPAALWPVTQVLNAAVLVAGPTGDATTAVALRRGLRAYARRGWYRSGVLAGRRYYDDAAWLGLAAADAWALGLEPVAPWRDLTLRALAFVRAGEVTGRRAPGGGGVPWRERWASVHACSTGSAGLLAVRVERLARRDGDDPPTGTHAFARRCLAVLGGPLALPGHLVADRIDPDGCRDSTVWSYNQGLPVALAALLDPDPAAARNRAADVVRAFPTDRWWAEPPAFAAILGRCLLVLHAVDGDPRWLAPVDAYLDRVVGAGLDRRGLLTAGGVGRYAPASRALDTAGVAGLAAARASRGQGLPRC